MRITRVFLDVHMGLAFQGLSEIAKRAKTPNDQDSTIIFINKKQTAFKMLRSKGYLVYYNNGNRKIPLEAIQYLPRYFGGTEAEMVGAIRLVLTRKLGHE
jgi:hypothetical protein